MDLTAFGPFTGRTLSFDSEEPGLHIVFGPNEAGKSSSLRALKALLYGFQQQTPDNFLHSYDQLLVGGCLENGAGETICFQRRKKRIGDVIDEAGNPLDPGVLAPFLLGLEPDVFESLYGIDHDTLVQGGEEILAQKGEVGQALFAAGAGISSLREVIDQLEKEALGLFKPAGQLPEINKAVKRFKQLKKEAHAASLSFRDWQVHRKAMTDAGAARTRLEGERDEKNTRLHRLERLAQAIPELAALKSWQERLQAVGPVVLLPPDFEDRYRQVSQALREADRQLQRDVERLEKLEARRQAISFNRELLDQAELVDDFHQRLGEYRKGQRDRPERNGMRISLRRDAARLLQLVRPDLTLDAVETLRPVLARKKTVRALSTQYEVISQRLKQAEKQRKAADRDKKDIEARLAAVPVVGLPPELLQAVKLAQKAGDLDAQLDERRNDVALNKEECLAAIKRIGLWAGGLDTLRSCTLPLSETVRQFESRFGRIADERREIAASRRNIDNEMKSAQVALNKVLYAGQVPSEEELARTREKREQGWQLLRRQWIDGEDVAAESRAYHTGQSLPEAYEGYVGQADRIADRLRREADRVAHAAALRARVEALQAAAADQDRLEAAIDLKQRELDDAWPGVWRSAGIVPLSPKEMIGWLAEMDTIRFKLSDIFKREQALGQDARRRADLRRALRQALEAMGEDAVPDGDALGPVLIAAETVLERIARRKAELEKYRERRKKASQAFHQATDDLSAARDDLAAWKSGWHKALSGLGVKGEMSTLDAADHIDTLQRCFDKLKDADDLKKRIDGIDRDAADLEHEVKALLEKVAPGLVALPLDQAILKLRTLLGQAQKDSTLYNQLAGEVDALEEEVAAARNTSQQAAAQMADLLRIARCDQPEGVAAVIDTFAVHQQLQEKMADTEAILARIAAGVPLDELARQAEQTHVDELSGRIASLRRDIDERINPEINRMSQVIGEENTRLAAMDGSARAAETAEEMEQELARIRRLADRYARVKIASRILQLEIERYREEHQDPVLKVAATYFKALTLGAFTGLMTDVDDKGEPILVGVRPDGLRLTVEKMSSGTRDQLYLALRLATLVWRLETGESMPFIVDDILINFDDDRSRATLEVLADLSRRNQVILFTHHRQIVDAAGRVAGKGPIVIHEL